MKYIVYCFLALSCLSCSLFDYGALKFEENPSDLYGSWVHYENAYSPGNKVIVNRVEEFYILELRSDFTFINTKTITEECDSKGTYEFTNARLTFHYDNCEDNARFPTFEYNYEINEEGKLILYPKTVICTEKCYTTYKKLKK